MSSGFLLSRPGLSRRGALGGGVAALAAFAVGTPAYALQVQPLSIALRSTGRMSTGSVEVQNSFDYPLPIEVKVERLFIGENGDPRYEDNSGEEFVILPPQATIAPGATQVFRIRWVGEPGLSESKIFMFSFQQLPVRRPNEPTGVRVLYSIGVAVAVAPPTGSARLAIPEAQRAVTKDGKPGVEILAANESNVHGYLRDYRIVVRQRDGGGNVVKQATFDPGQVSSIAGIGLIPAFGRRRFVLPFDAVAGTDVFTAEVGQVGR